MLSCRYKTTWKEKIVAVFSYVFCFGGPGGGIGLLAVLVGARTVALCATGFVICLGLKEIHDVRALA